MICISTNFFLKHHYFYFLAVLSIFLFSGLLTENCVPLEDIMLLLLDGSHVSVLIFSHHVNKFFFVGQFHSIAFILKHFLWGIAEKGTLALFQLGTAIYTGNVCSCFSGLGSSCRVVIVDTGARFLSISVGFLWAEML